MQKQLNGQFVKKKLFEPTRSILRNIVFYRLRHSLEGLF